MKSVANADRKGGSLTELLIGAGGVYAAFMYYGVLQEEITKKFVGHDGQKFTYTWFIQVTNANVFIVGIQVYLFSNFVWSEHTSHRFFLL